VEALLLALQPAKSVETTMMVTPPILIIQYLIKEEKFWVNSFGAHLGSQSKNRVDIFSQVQEANEGF